MWAWMAALGVSQYAGIVSSAYGVYRPKRKDFFNPQYLDYLMRIKGYAGEYLCRSKGIWSSRLLLGPDAFFNIPIIHPPLEDQNAIVAFLEKQTAVINQFLTNKRRLIALLEEQKQVVINTAVTQGLDTAVSCKPSGIDNLGDIPAHWQMLRNKYIFTEVADRSETGEELQLSVHQQLGIIPRSEIADRPMEESPTIGSKRCQVGDLILNRLKAHLGVFFRTELDGVVSPDYTVFRPKRDVSTKYFEYLFRHPVYMGIWNKTVRGIVAGFYRLYTDDFGNVASVFPPPDEQRAIVKFIDEKTAEINTAIERTQREIELIEEYRTTLIAHAVTGKIDVSGARHGP
jgi:type I restriction enzyme S subunit